MKTSAFIRSAGLIAVSAAAVSCPPQPEAVYPDRLIVPGEDNGSKAVKTAADYDITQKPNVIFILLDDAGYGDIGCNGQTNFRTPNIDRLAENGIRFVNHYAGAPVSASSRCALLTGKTTGHSFIRGNLEFGSGVGLYPSSVTGEGQKGLPASEYTLAQLFKENGYNTALVGKWGLGMPEEESSPSDKGFDKYYGHLCQRMAHSYFPDHVWENDAEVPLEGNTGEAGPIWLHDEFEKKTAEYLSEFLSSQKPFFFFGTYTIPHGALQIPEGKLNDVEYHPYTTAGWWSKASDDMKRYAVMMHRLDLTVGKIIDQVKASGKADNTLILFSSDNGPADEYGADPDFFESAGRFGEERLRGIKRALYEGGVKVPFIASWNGKIKPGVSEHIFASYDIMATVAQILGTDLSEKTQTDGLSFLPVLMGDTANQKQHPYLYWEFVGSEPSEGGGPRQGVRSGDWKAVLNFGEVAKAKAGEGAIELYHLGDDPGETINLASVYPNIISSMRRIMSDAHENTLFFPQIEK